MQVLRMLLSADLMPNVVTLNALLSAVVSAGVSGNEHSEEQVLTLLALLVQKLLPKSTNTDAAGKQVRAVLRTPRAARTCITAVGDVSFFTPALLMLY
jgi:hypothetical protein